MPKMTAMSAVLQKQRQSSAFSLVELLTVIAIIAILAALTLGAASGVMTHASRCRAAGEIEAMKSALDAYKIDNGAYPVGTTAAQPAASALLGPGTTPAAYPLDPTPTGGQYQIASEALFQALTGTANYTVAPAAGVKSYMSFKVNQVGLPTAALSYIKDPWNNPYGYSTGDATVTPQTKYPNNGIGSFDLWSTAGTTAVTASNPTPVNTWITNWQ
jgi:prepilin-type N-terminal cleavage/methylation domain-containing protein